MSRFKYLLLSFALASCIPMGEQKSELKFSSTSETREPSSIVPEADDPEETQFLDSRSLNIRFGDNIFLSNYLDTLFGSSSSNCKTIIKGNVYNQPKIFGGVCDKYNNGTCNDQAVSDPSIPTSTLRAGRMMKTCEELLRNNTCLDYFLAKANLTAASELSQENIQKAYHKFYPLDLEGPEFSVMVSLNNLFEKLDNNRNKWRALGLSLCMTPSWQIP